MPDTLSRFEEIDGLEGIFSARKGTLRCTAIRMRDGGLCLFSPVAGLSAEATDSLAALGNVSFLLAPNHYHNKGLTEYALAFPKAALVAPELAIPRLEKVTELIFFSLEAFTTLLPDIASILQPPGLKTGEIWISLRYPELTTWMVVDAFCTMKENSRHPVTDKPELLGTFPKMGVADAKAYRFWVDEQLSRDQPGMIVPCHGSVIHSDQLPAKIGKLMEEAF